MSQVKVLFVCTGNICRSPSAEGVLRHKLAEAALDQRVGVDSAGLIDYHAGDPPSRLAVDCARERGYDLTDLRARKFQRKDFETFDLIISMDRSHHMQLLSMCPDRSVGKLHLFMDFSPPPLRSPDCARPLLRRQSRLSACPRPDRRRHGRLDRNPGARSPRRDVTVLDRPLERVLGLGPVDRPLVGQKAGIEGKRLDGEGRQPEQGVMGQEVLQLRPGV